MTSEAAPPASRRVHFEAGGPEPPGHAARHHAQPGEAGGLRGGGEPRADAILMNRPLMAGRVARRSPMRAAARTTLSAPLLRPLQAGPPPLARSHTNLPARVPEVRQSSTLNPADSSSSSAVNYIPMNEASLEFCPDQLELRVQPKQYKCLCGVVHVVLGTKLFLVFYVLLTLFGLVFGMVSAMVWTGIPFLVTAMTIYGFCRKKHKYLYPFLIISVVQLIVCLIMGLVIAIFSIANYETLKMILAHNLQSEPSTTAIVAIVGGAVFSCCLLAVIHVWQVIVIYSCLQYFEFDLRLDRVLVSTHGEPTGHAAGHSFFDGSQKMDADGSDTEPPQMRRGSVREQR